MAEEDSWKRGNEEEDEEEIDETQYKHAKDAVLFAIDVSKSMLTPPPKTDVKKPDLDSPLSAAMKCAYTLMQQRIISSPNDMIGILLYNMKETKLPKDNPSGSIDDYDHCYLLTDLCRPAADDVRTLKDLVLDKGAFDKLMVPSEEPTLMANVLFCANQIFATRAANFASRRLFIVTDNDNPHEKKEEKQSASVRAKDLYDLGVMIELFPIEKPGDEFDKKKFYNDIVYNAQPSNPEASASMTPETKVSSSGDGITLLSSLLSSIASRAVPKRAQFSNMPFEIGPGFRISVKGYIIFKRQTPARTCYVWTGGEKTQVAKGITERQTDSDSTTVEKSQIRKAYRFGGEQITFTPEEISKIRHFDDPIIRVIGFKPWNERTLPIWANITRSTFIYPSEDDYVGSTRVYSALYQKLLSSTKFALAWFVARKNATPQIVAIVPGQERADETGEQFLPPGLWLIPLPYADDIRDNPESPLVPASDDLIDRMRDVVQHLHLPKTQFNPAKFPNPALQWHYRILQAMALEEELPEKPEDKTVPKYRQMHKRVGQYLVEWGQQLEADHRKWEGENRSMVLPKRPAAKEGVGKESKRIKLEEGSVGVSDMDMRKASKNQAVGKMTVAELKAWMNTKALETGGKKAELVERVEAWFESQ